MTTKAASRRGHDSRTLHVVSALEDHGLVDPARHLEAMDVVEQSLGIRAVEGAPMRRRLAELAGYVGGAFVVAAAGLFLADQWPNLSVAQRVGLLGGITVLLLAAGLAVRRTGGGIQALSGEQQQVRRRLASVLFTAGAAAGAATTVVWLIDLIEQRGTEMTEGNWIGLGGSLVLIVLALGGYLLAHSLLGQLAVALGAAYAVPFALGVAEVEDPIVIGIVVLVVGAVWLVLAERGAWHELVPARVIGSLFVLVGAQIPIGSDQPWVAYLLTILVAGVGFAMYVGRRAWPYLAVGVVGVTLAVPEALMDWTEGSLGTAGVLLVAGVTLLGASLLGLRLRKEVAGE
ncbi:MAG TPA: hypothetical protein VFZ64_11915 [Nocardioidaceae bacterium]